MLATLGSDPITARSLCIRFVFSYLCTARDSRISFFAVLATLAGESVLGQSLRSRVRDKFRTIGVSKAVAQN